MIKERQSFARGGLLCDRLQFVENGERGTNEPLTVFLHVNECASEKNCWVFVHEVSCCGCCYIVCLRSGC